MHEPIDLTAAGPGDFKRTRSRAVEAVWMVVEFLLITNPLQISSRLRVWALQLFGARIGANIIMRPRVRVKFPWNLQIGDNCWIGEGVWIHNQGLVTIEDNTVVSQETFITTGSHDVLRRGAWLTTRCIVLQGVEVGQNTVVTPGSVVRQTLPPNRVYGGNPAVFISERWKASNKTHSQES
jgi:putative colanic acid biosynthesis acetyltransferase WcaF